MLGEEYARPIQSELLNYATHKTNQTLSLCLVPSGEPEVIGVTITTAVTTRVSGLATTFGV